MPPLSVGDTFTRISDGTTWTVIKRHGRWKPYDYTIKSDGGETARVFELDLYGKIKINPKPNE